MRGTGLTGSFFHIMPPPPGRRFWGKLSEWCLNYVDPDLDSLSGCEKVLSLLEGRVNPQYFKEAKGFILTVKFFLHQQKIISQQPN